MNDRVYVYHSRKYDLNCYGRGIAYALHDNIGKQSLFVEGDDAADFALALDHYENRFPEAPFDDIMAELMNRPDKISWIVRDDTLTNRRKSALMGQILIGTFISFLLRKINAATRFYLACLLTFTIPLTVYTLNHGENGFAEAVIGYVLL